MKEKNSFTVINDEGKEVVCDVLFTFDSEETNKSYIAYTDNTKDKNGNVQVYASIYDPNEENPGYDSGSGSGTTLAALVMLRMRMLLWYRDFCTLRLGR